MATAEFVCLLVPPALRGLVHPHKKRKKLASKKVKVRAPGPWPCRRAPLLPRPLSSGCTRTLPLGWGRMAPRLGLKFLG